ncbi:MAG: metallophosphoesterase [Lachnospiraceae bacterium]|nr:metallophosphoesterase [Lachnospiraceae bacterium]
MRLIRCRQYTVEVPGFEAGEHLRLAFLSDLHNNVYPGLLKMLEEAAPDAVLIGGDMANRPTRLGTPPRYTRGYGCVSKIVKEFPVWYAFGNHEASWRLDETYGASFHAYQRALKKKGVVFLENEYVVLRAGSRPVVLYGLEMGRPQYTHHAKKRRPPTQEELRTWIGEALPDAFTVLLAHHPDYLESYAAWGADLVLAGHLHGGQVRLPGIGGLLAPGFGLFPRYTRGRYEAVASRPHPTVMIVSPGLGTHTVPFRLFNPRELVIVDLTGRG